MIINRFLHFLSHLFETNTGKVVSWVEDDFVYVGFECDGCKKIDPKSVDKVEICALISERGDGDDEAILPVYESEK